jgi:cytidylate kinase
MTTSSTSAFTTVAIDGGAATGKSSTAKGLARKLGYLHVDTGSHYRALTFLCLAHGVTPVDEPGIAALLAKSPLGTAVEGVTGGGAESRIVVDGRVPAEADIRSDAVNASVSKFAALPLVRDALKAYQRGQREVAMSHGYAGLVMEGRDIGSVIFPDAELKIFLEADEATRAARRAKDGQTDDVAGRDRQDASRKTAPLVCPPGAVRVDNSRMSLTETINAIAAMLGK